MKRFAAILFIISQVSLRIPAQGNLSVSPTRLTINEKDYTNTVTINNTGNDSAFYEISFTEFRMTEEGKLEKCATEDSMLRFASPYLQIFPREIDLAPGETQTIMVRFKPGPKLSPGEYRSHLYFKPIKRHTPKEAEIQRSGFRIIPLLGITIPVLLRTGETWSEAKITELKYSSQNDSAWWINFGIERRGNISLYGDAEVFYSPFFGTEYPVGSVKGIAAYTNLSVRKVAIRISPPAGMTFRSGEFIVRYTDPTGRKRVLAERKTKVL